MAGVAAMEVDNNASEEVSESAATKSAQATGESSKKGSYELPWYVYNVSNFMFEQTIPLKKKVGLTVLFTMCVTMQFI